MVSPTYDLGYLTVVLLAVPTV